MASTSVFLNVADIAKSIEFYKGLGFAVAFEGKSKGGEVTWVDMDLDGAGIGLGHIPSNSEPAFQAWVTTPLGAGVVVYVTVDDVDAIWKKAQALRAVIEVPIEDRSYGRVFTLNDPDGYTITFIRER